MRRASTLIATSALRAWDVVAPHVSTSSTTHLTGLDARHAGHVELDHLGRYVGFFALIGACLLIMAWSRIDLRQTSVALDRADRATELAQADQARLQLELASLTDPSQLAQAAQQLDLLDTVAVVRLPAP